MRDALLRTADRIEAAWKAARPLSDSPPDLADLEDGYRIQAELTRRLGPIAGWKVGALTPAQQAKRGVAHPIAAALLKPFVRQSPARFSARDFIAPRLECEFAFLLYRDVPPRAVPYSRDEVAAAIAGVCPAIEIADSRAAEDCSTALFLADFMGSGGFVHGAANASWRAIDLARSGVALRINGHEVARGTGAAILGDPFAAVVALANAQPQVGDGLKAGHVVTTGSCTGMIPVAAGDEAVATFENLGEVRVSFAV